MHIPKASVSIFCRDAKNIFSTLFELNYLVMGQQHNTENAKRTKMFANKLSLF